MASKIALKKPYNDALRARSLLVFCESGGLFLTGSSYDSVVILFKTSFQNISEFHFTERFAMQSQYLGTRCHGNRLQLLRRIASVVCVILLLTAKQNIIEKNKICFSRDIQKSYASHYNVPSYLIADFTALTSS